MREFVCECVRECVRQPVCHRYHHNQYHHNLEMMLLIINISSHSATLRPGYCNACVSACVSA